MAETYVSLRDEALMRRYPEIFGPGPWPVNDTMLGWGLTIGDGWMSLLERLCADLSSIIAEDDLADFRTQQVKEKFGSLRIYARGGNERTWALIEAAVRTSQQTCEGCGDPSKIRSWGGWHTTMCDACIERQKRDSGK